MRTALPVEEREFIMETREWFERFQAERMQHAVQQAEERGQLQVMARICGTRLGRPLSEAENATLASLIARVGVDRVTQAVIAFSPEALASWLAEPQME